MSKRHLRLIARNNVRYSVRSGAGLIFLFFALIVGLMFADCSITPFEMMEQELGSKANAELATQMFAEKISEIPLVEDLLGDKEQQKYLLREKPIAVSIFIVLMLFGTPLLITLGAFNQFAGDIGNRGFRYLLLRTERKNVFFGRFIGTVIFVAISYLLLFAVTGLYLVLKLKTLPMGETILWLGQGYLATMIFAIPYIALCSWISTWLGSSFAVLALTQVIIGLPPVLILIATRTLEHAHYIGYLMPWPWRQWLIHPSIGRVLLATLVMAVFTGVFLWLGYKHFEKRDL